MELLLTREGVVLTMNWYIIVPLVIAATVGTLIFNTIATEQEYKNACAKTSMVTFTRGHINTVYICEEKE